LRSPDFSKANNHFAGLKTFQEQVFASKCELVESRHWSLVCSHDFICLWLDRARK